MRMAIAVPENHFNPYQQNHQEIPLHILLKQQTLIYQWGKDNVTAKAIAHLNMPVLILNGAQDIIIPPINSMILAHTIPYATLVRWQDGGHGMTFQYPDEIAAVINHFI